MTDETTVKTALDPFGSVTELARMIRERVVSPVEVGRFYLDRVDRHNPQLNAFIWRDDESFLAAAREAEHQVMHGADLGPFHGVPLAIKDVHGVKGQPNVRGSWAVSDEPCAESDLIIERFVDAGFLPFGRTAIPELASGLTCESVRYGVSTNPWDMSRTPGGSTGGGAAAVAAGLVPSCTATDGGGSIRMPASACGLVGLKPTRALLPHRFPNWESSSVDGFLARGVADTAAILDAIAAPDPYAWIVSATPAPAYTAALGIHQPGLRIGLMLDPPTGAAVDPICADAATDVAAVLESLGHSIIPTSSSIIDAEAIRLFNEIVMPAGSQLLDYTDEARMDPNVRARIHLADAFRSRDYVRASTEMKHRLRAVVAHWHHDFDVLLTPTLPTTVPSIASILRDATLPPKERGTASLGAFLRFVNYTGQPAISLPTHLDPDGIPVGVQLVGRAFAESTLLRLADALEVHYRWLDRRPAEPPIS